MLSGYETKKSECVIYQPGVYFSARTSIYGIS